MRWEHSESRNQTTKQNNRMETLIPQPTLRFLTSGISKRIIWNVKDAIRTHRLPFCTRSPLHSFHNPVSLLSPLPSYHSFLSPMLRPPPRFLCNMTETQSPPTKTVRISFFLLTCNFLVNFYFYEMGSLQNLILRLESLCNQLYVQIEFRVLIDEFV